MSNDDSFITEVTEAVQRDRLFGLMRRYGWIAVLLVVVVVGGAAWNEYRKGQTRTQAQAAGDALLTALDENDPADRVAALQSVQVSGPAGAVAALLTASELQAEGEDASARATLERIAVDPSMPPDYRDLAAIKALMLPDPDRSEADRRTALEALAAPGSTYRLLALEQIALSDVASGDTEAALVRLASIVEDAGVTQAQRDRAQGLIVALGGTVDADAATR